jgi:hypothetical protein
MIVKGEDVLVLEYVDALSEWVLYGCARTCSLNFKTSMIETSVTGAQGWYTGVAGQHSFTGTLDGLVNLEEENLISLADLRKKQIDRNKLRLRFQRTAIDGLTVYTEEADFYITSSNDEGTINNFNTFNIELQGTGSLSQVFTPSTILTNVKRFQYTANGGEVQIETVKNIAGVTVSLIGKTVIGFWRKGEGLSKQLVTGTPIAAEFKHDSVTGYLHIATAASADEEFFGFYQ